MSRPLPFKRNEASQYAASLPGRIASPLERKAALEEVYQFLKGKGFDLPPTLHTRALTQLR